MKAHDILGVRHGASAAEIKQAYKLLARRWHPDREGGDAEKFVEVSKAYAMLYTQKPSRKVCDYCMGLGESANCRCPKCKGKGVV